MPDIYYLFIASLIGSVLLTLGIVFLYVKLVKDFVNLKKDYLDLEGDLRSKEEKVLAEADSEYRKIIEEAHLKAKSMIDLSQTFSNEQKRSFDTEIAKTREDYKSLIGSMLSQMQSDTVKIFESISKSIKESGDREVQIFKSNLESQVVDSEKALTELIGQEVAKAGRDLDEYKNKRFKEIDAQAFEIIKKAAFSSIRKTLTQAEHEKIVIDAIEQAKVNINAKTNE